MNATHKHSASNKSAEKPFAERVAEARSEVPSVSAAEAHERQQCDPDTVFVDPRPATAIRETTGMISGALNISLQRLTGPGDLPSALSSHSRPVIAACQCGPMGALAAQALKHRGFGRVAYLDGGTQAWLDAGYPTER